MSKENRNGSVRGVGRRQFLKGAGMAAAATFAASSFSTRAFAAAQEVKFAHIFNDSQPFHKWVLWASDQILEKTQGRYKISVFPSSSLGGEVEIYQGLTLGTIDMGFTGSPTASRAYGPMALISGPYMFRDFDHWAAYRDSDMRKQVTAEFNTRSNLNVVGTVYYGLRHVTSNKKIAEPDDMKGLKLRVPNVPLYLLFPRSVGANPTPIAFSEVYLALQQGVVDGQENPLPTIFAQKFYEVQKHIALTGHMIDTLVAMTSSSLWSQLSDEDKQIFSQVFDEAMAKCTDEVRATEMSLINDFKTKYNVSVDEVDREAFRKKMIPELTGENVPWSKSDYEKVQLIT
ncbi:sialic acid TRAP transporter substrate-binding protein SiaP [Thalassospira sp. NFXS8]|uniref:sialic acid TRAP transporter substrate-binding protein SiaP n=1 Tax=Thalassospira sp. NFXS8 TaxID=2819093 RepID=UPI0032DEA210